MHELESNLPYLSTEDEIEVDAETAAAIEEGIRAADEGRVLPSDGVRDLIPECLEAIMASWREHPETAEWFADSFLNHVDMLKRFPYLGTPLKRYRRARRLLHSPFHVYYRVHPERRAVEILRIRHCSRRIPAP